MSEVRFCSRFGSKKPWKHRGFFSVFYLTAWDGVYRKNAFAPKKATLKYKRRWRRRVK